MSSFSAKQMLLGKDILLEAGTNELEILVFYLDGGPYGVNVAKVREVITPLTVYRLPETHESVEGAFRLRDKVVPLIDLRHYLDLKPYTDEERRDKEASRIIVTEFNQTINGFRVDAVEQIHRLSWEQIQPMPRIGGSGLSPLTAIAKINEKLVPMLDFEMIIDRIKTINQLRTGPVPNKWNVDRGSQFVAVAEHSATVQQHICESKTSSGYKNVNSFTNGQDLWNWLCQRASEPGGRVDIVISDIEMPQIDGLHLTKRIREHAVLKDLPVVLFSSLITADNIKKGQAVGATEQISKPQLHTVVELVDEILANGGKRAAVA
jgi:two-component system chemotaxis response regulator CheV